MEPASLVTSLQTEIAALVAHYKAQAGTSVTLQQLTTIATSAVASLLRLFHESGATLDQAEVETAVLDAAGQLFDALAPLINIPFIPSFLETQIIDPALKTLFLNLVQGAMDSLVQIFNRTGFTESPATTAVLAARAPVPAGLRFLPY